MRKKIFILFILINTVLFFVSCQGTYSNQEQHTIHMQTNAIVPEAGYIATPSYDSIEKYQSFLESTDLPENFIFYENISSLGEFDGFILSDYVMRKNSGYMYMLTDDAGIELTLYVDPIEDKLSASNIITESKINPSDMRLLNTADTGIYTKSGITYKYARGKLLSIEWQYGDLMFTLCSVGEDPWLAFYPSDTSTVTAQLLNDSTAPTAVTSLLKSVSE